MKIFEIKVTLKYDQFFTITNALNESSAQRKAIEKAMQLVESDGVSYDTAEWLAATVERESHGEEDKSEDSRVVENSEGNATAI